MLQVPGAPALSAFRVAKLLARLATLEPAVRSLEARFIHFVDTARPLEFAEREILQRLLTYGPRIGRPRETAPGEAANDPFASDPDGDTLLVVPRAGTISPWSSKATDIAHVCGLTAVRRIERGIVWTLALPRSPSRDELKRLTSTLF